MTVPTSAVSWPVSRISCCRRSAEMAECPVIKSTIRSWILARYSNACGTAMIVPFMRTGWIVMAAEAAIKLFLAATASGTPIEWPPPSTRETVGLVMPAISSAIASPASTSPPTVFSSTSIPSISSACSTAAICGIRCSYLVVLFCAGSSMCPSIWPTIVMQCTVPRAVLAVIDPVSAILFSSGAWIGIFSSCMFFLPFNKIYG